MVAVAAVTVLGAAVPVAAVQPGALRPSVSAGSHDAGASNDPVGSGGKALIFPSAAAAKQDALAARGYIAARAAELMPADLTGFTIPASRQIREPSPVQAGPAAATASGSAAPGPVGTPPPGTPPRQLIVPDLIAATPTGITARQLAEIRKLAGVRAVLAMDGGQIMVNGKAANVIGVSPQAFRSWTPPQTATSVSAWTNLAHGDLLASSSAAGKLGLKTGAAYPLSGATALTAPLGGALPLGIPGIDGVVDTQRSAQLGLIKNLAVLINAPAANLTTLMSQVRSVIGSGGKGGQVINLVPVVEVSNLPVAPVSVSAGQVPSNWLTLYKDSAAEYCQGLSWTVLAAIGEIESGNGANNGPSSAGALGPMQFMPATWAVWGIRGFGQTGPPNIMNPLDAVPSAARMLCADGATNGAAGLRQAIFDYNHANWYVDEVLQLATEYAKSYG